MSQKLQVCTECKHIRSAVIGLAHALCRDTWQARRCVVIVLVLRNSGCTTVYNKSKLTVRGPHNHITWCQKWDAEVRKQI